MNGENHEICYIGGTIKSLPSRRGPGRACRAEYGGGANAERTRGLLADHQGVTNVERSIAHPSSGTCFPGQKAEILAISSPLRRCRAPVATVLRKASESRRLR